VSVTSSSTSKLSLESVLTVIFILGAWGRSARGAVTLKWGEGRRTRGARALTDVNRAAHRDRSIHQAQLHVPMLHHIPHAPDAQLPCVALVLRALRRHRAPG
jgi:hypothetical protein